MACSLSTRSVPPLHTSLMRRSLPVTITRSTNCLLTHLIFLTCVLFFFLFFLRSIAGRCILSSLASRWHVIALFSWLFLSKFPLSYKVVILYKRGKKIYTSKIVIKKKTLQKLNLYCYVPNYLPVTCLPSSLSYMYTQTFLSLLPVFAETTYTLPSPTVTSLTCSPTIQHPHLPSLANHRLLTYNSLNNNLRLNTSPFLPMNTHPPTAPYLNLPFFRC